MHQHVAVVDDEESVRLALARSLRASFYEVTAFSGGQAFLDSLPEQTPDCVILDFHMPELSGRDVQRALARAKLQIPIIMVTAHDAPALREQCLADGAVAYFAKPLRRELLIGEIRKVGLDDGDLAQYLGADLRCRAHGRCVGIYQAAGGRVR